MKEPETHTLFPDLDPEDRERAINNLNRYAEIVLGIFLRMEREERERKERSSPSPPQVDDTRGHSYP